MNDQISRLHNRARHYPHLGLVLLIVVCAAAAIFVFDDYGESWDEPNIQLYAASTQDAYMAGLGGQPLTEEHLGPFNLRFYGPVSFVLSDLFADGLGALFPYIHPVDFWHLSYFLAFLVSVVCIYWLCLRWVGRAAALAATLLFVLQPLLWGHAFINPKDTPFMAFFLLSVVLGLRAADMTDKGKTAWPAWVLAGVVLGAATAIRVSAPLAGAIVAVEMLARRRTKALWPLAVYAGVTIVVTYLAWPYLWGEPLQHFVDVFNEMRNFPMDIGVRFNGMDLRSVDLPVDYLPRLIALQLTLPVVILFGVGLFAIWLRWQRGQLQEPRLLAIVGAWFLLPVLLVMLSQPTLYDNFRQFLFILPPLFVVAAIALDEFFLRLMPALAWSLVAAVAAPGLLSMAALHPYEYAFYNRLAGDPATLVSRYETDYWVTSYREAISYVNEVAPEGSKIFLFGDGGPAEFLTHFGRADLTTTPRAGANGYDFVILTTRFGTADQWFPHWTVTFQVERQGLTFAVVKELK